MIDRRVISRRVEEIDLHLGRIQPYSGFTLHEFKKDLVAQDVVEYNLFQIVNHMIDILQHIVVDEGFGYPQTAYEAGEILSQKGIIDDHDLGLFRKMVGFRNVVGHDYLGIDKEIVHSILTEGTKEIKSLLTKIVKTYL